MIQMKKKSGQKVPTLDLHGYRVDEVFDALEAFLQKHQRASRVRVMPGKGSGAVRTKVQEYLRLANYPFQAERMDNGQVNEGVLVVFME